MHFSGRRTIFASRRVIPALAVGFASLAWTCGLATAEDLELPQRPAGEAFSSSAPGFHPDLNLPRLSSSAARFSANDDPDASSASSKRRSTLLRELGIASAAIGAGFLLDDTFEPGSRSGTLMDDAGEIIGSPLTLGAGTGVMALGGWAGKRAPTLDTAKRLALAITTTTVTVGILKLAIQRERPDGSIDNSFPSGHSGASFTAATVLDRQYGVAVGWVAYSVAAFVAASRVAGNHHYFSDVVAGAVIGRFYGRLFTRGG